MATILYYGTSTQIHSGAAQWMFRLADRMREFGHETIAVLPDRDGIAEWYESAGITTRTCWAEPVQRQSLAAQAQYPFQSLRAVRELRRLIDDEGVDVLHVNEIRYLPAVIAGATSDVRTLTHTRICLESPKLRKVFGTIGATLSDRVLCVSNRTADMMFRSVGHERSVDVLHDGLPTPERFDPLPDGEVFRTEFDVDEDAFLVVSVSKLVENKAQDRLLAAAERMRDEPIEFAIVGGRVDGHEAYADGLERRVEDLQNARLTGFYEDLPEVLGAADVLVHVPRHEDPFPGVVLEGMTAGVPVIGSKSGGIPEQIDDGETGYLVDKTGDVEGITDRVRHLERNPDVRRRLGETGKRRARERFDPDTYFGEIDAIYRDLSGERRSQRSCGPEDERERAVGYSSSQENYSM
ncbi:glycosyltransferase family 4 protein [Halopiger goleimassiliensis]|uniref:glycosyltransferase family 4 protein n=1 Tax=Halopiger goleimassiliensis TaxID=1293048 RepID=UPI000677B37A|nr:glycosyltransferase family 4 protein [Halopiger goleimassiliensis]